MGGEAGPSVTGGFRFQLQPCKDISWLMLDIHFEDMYISFVGQKSSNMRVASIFITQ